MLTYVTERIWQLMNLVKLPIYELPTDERFRVQNFDIL